MAWLGWLWIVPVLGVLIFIHELGHFVTARLFGIRVDEFALGFPPRLLSVRRGGVDYSLNAIPIGGYVKIHGENGEDRSDPRSFGAKPPWQRAIVLSAGALMNVLLAMLLFAGLALSTGLPRSDGAVIRAVAPGSPAAAALRPDDRLLRVGDQEITDQTQVGLAIRDYLGSETPITVGRGGRELTVLVAPRANPPEGQGPLGISTAPERAYLQRYGPLEAIPAGVGETVRWTGRIVEAIGELIRGRFADISGPVGIAQMTGEVANRGGYADLLQLTAVLSVNLFLMNLLPLPALDGGRLVFVLLEAVRGRRVAPQREAVVHGVGMLLLLTLMVVISVFDVRRILGGISLIP